MPGVDRVDPDVVGPELERRGLGEAAQPPLRGGVGRGRRDRDVRRHRADVDDRPAAGAPHRRVHVLHAQERAGEVGVEHAAPFLDRELGDRRDGQHAGVVDQDRDRPERLLGEAHRRSPRAFVGDVERGEARAVAELVGDGGALGLEHIADDDPRSLGRQRASVGLAHAPRPPVTSATRPSSLAMNVVISYDDARCNPGGDRGAARDRGGRAARARRPRGRRPDRRDRRVHHRCAQRARRRRRGAAHDPRPRGGGDRRGDRRGRRARARRRPRRRGRHAGVRRVLLVHPRSARPVRGDARRHPPAARGRHARAAARPSTPTAASGAFAERMVLRDSGVVAVDADVSDEHLSLLGCGVTAASARCSTSPRCRPARRWRSSARGALGLWMIQGARVAGAATIVAVEPRAERRELALHGGRDARGRPRRRRSGGAVKALTGGRGADYVLEAAGPPEAMTQALAMTRPAGTMVPAGLGDAVVHGHLAGGRLRHQRQAHPELPVRRRAHPPRRPALRGDDGRRAARRRAARRAAASPSRRPTTRWRPRRPRADHRASSSPPSFPATLSV